MKQTLCVQGSNHRNKFRSSNRLIEISLKPIVSISKKCKNFSGCIFIKRAFFQNGEIHIVRFSHTTVAVAALVAIVNWIINKGKILWWIKINYASSLVNSSVKSGLSPMKFSTEWSKSKKGFFYRTVLKSWQKLIQLTTLYLMLRIL